jgi:molybdopterin/thiamine biosynthesis adenylyltransferase
MAEEQAVTRYDRQERVKDWNQVKLQDAKVVVVGAGALGTVTALQLACLGFGRVDIYDFFTVVGHNLNRQFFYFYSVGKQKSVSLAFKLKFINPEIRINAFTEKLTNENISYLKDYDIIFDCADNWTVRKLINNFCLLNKQKFIHGGMRGFEGQIQCINPALGTPCLECLPLPVEDKPTSVCEVDPAIITTSFLIGSIMAQEGVKMIMYPKDVCYDLIVYSGYGEDLKKMGLKKNPKCVACGKKKQLGC